MFHVEPHNEELMSNEPTIDQINTTIAIFVGYEKYEDGYGIWFKKNDDARSEYSLMALDYHYNWNNLMNAWFKAQNIGADLGYSFKKFYKQFHAGIDHQDILISHKALYDFIQWYNSVR